MEPIATLKQFYESMNSTIDIRKKITSLYLKRKPISEDFISALETTLKRLKSIPQHEGKSRVELTEEKTIDLDLSYEINELKKDLLFVENGEEYFLEHLNSIHENFASQVNQGIDTLKGISFQTFVSDRDGTVNNYCGRYASSVQSIYNAVFLSRFAQNCTQSAVILTSAPLMNVGLANISVTPLNTFIYAGSNGREYLNRDGTSCYFPVEKDGQKKLDEFNKDIGDLLKKTEYEKYSLIGSGLQYKFGQTTIARQDISRTIPEEASQQFLNKIQEIIKSIDPGNKFFKIEDTGLDVEVILTIAQEGSEELKAFDKGDGIKFIDKDAGLQMAQGPCLICGDTNSDVSMIKAAQQLTNQTLTIFVTTNEDLKDKVRTISPDAYFVDTPDILVTILNQLACL